ncbi:putative RNA helicase [Helianthus annuus]|nr:putative RNA helicase [Helianthus annuus]KAJ0617989.1 putative RNA helicase [Helianthus annuus]
MVALGSKYFKGLWLFMSYFGLNSNKTQLWSMCSSSICHHDRFFHLCILTQDSVKQYKVNLPDELSKIIKDKIMKLGGQTVIFGGTRKSAQTLHEALVKHGYAVTTIEGALTQDDKDKIIEEFKDGLTQVLISTHFLAQGFDQCQVNLVVNYDLPAIFDDPTELDNEAYLHRVGRAGRFGRKGVAFNLLCGDDDNILMEKIERHFHGVTEVPSDGDFKDALKKAGLITSKLESYTLPTKLISNVA